MFNIPTFYQQNMDFDTAKAVFNGDLLKGMEMIQEHWDRYATGNSGDMYEDDDEFFATWEYEVNAYNVVYSTMKPLFA
tara:strand:- start:845 stop:1078 length:234 start_codon:yes stop_codon:yes gene_type:complete